MRQSNHCSGDKEQTEVIYMYRLHLRLCSVARRPPASEEGGMVALSHSPPFLGIEQKYFNGEFPEHCI